jgi:radical SAM superfamily enzyme YgiQ (UPF0313 family)
MQNQNLDCVIINVPGTLSRSVLAAPALLKSVLVTNGFTCRCLDYNITFLREFENREIFPELENYFLTGVTEYQEIKAAATDLVNRYVSEICKLRPTYVAISVFTYQSRTAAVLFSELIKKHDKDIKIILGGQGLSQGINGEMNFAVDLLENGTIDFFIKSEGETALLKLLQKNVNWPGINSPSFNQTKDIDSLPFPNYDDYDFSFYEQPVTLPITGSRGCVRKCTFCDIHQHWRYTYRSGESIAKEIITQSQKYKIYDFRFTDSLINGNIREFKRMIEFLSAYNQANPGSAVSWGGQFIVHPLDHVQDETYWFHLKTSGAKNLNIGVESGSESVRQHMKKNFSDRELDHNMNMFEKYGITCSFLMIFGYPTETLEDFNLTLNMLERYQHLAGKIITKLELGSTMAILPGSPLYDMAHDLDIDLDRQENNWIAHQNLELTLEERIRRRHYAKDFAEKLGYSTEGNNDNFIKEYLVRNLDALNKRTKIRKILRIKQSSQPVS